MHTPSISVIVPIYNVERYLRKCLDTILMQTFTDFELLLVNDKSPDDSIHICKQYADKDERVVIIDKPKNEGVDKARFSGLEAARGTYVVFIDADDWLYSSTVFEHMIQTAENTGVDIVQMRRRPIFNSYSLINFKWLGSWTSGLIEQPTLRENYWPTLFRVDFRIHTTMWAKLYRKSTLDQAHLKPTGLWIHEDTMFNLQLWPYLRSIYCLNEVAYCYRWPWKKSYKDILTNDKLFFTLSQELVDRYAFHKVWDGIRINILNCLRNQIDGRIKSSVEREREVVVWLEGELQDPLWDVATDIREHRDVLDAPFTQAVHNKDAQKCYEIVRDMRPSIRARIQRRVISFAYLLLRYL